MPDVDPQFVLIVEDDGLIAASLADAVEAAGWVVVGPVPSVGLALTLLDATVVTAAILDAQLVDRDITPVAEKLAEAGIPLVIHSGTGLPEDMKQTWPDLPVELKPATPEKVIKRLAGQIEAKS